MGGAMKAGDEGPAIVALVRPMARMMRGLSLDARLILLTSLLCQEICTLPPGERPAELGRVRARLPGILAATEEGMRAQLAENAREGG